MNIQPSYEIQIPTLYDDCEHVMHSKFLSIVQTPLCKLLPL